MNTRDVVIYHVRHDPQTGEEFESQEANEYEWDLLNLLLLNMTDADILKAVKRINRHYYDFLDDNQTLAFKHLAKCLRTGQLSIPESKPFRVK
jgi:hypothetical protein